MLATEMHQQTATLLRAVRTETGERREHMLQEARLWISLATLAADGTEDMPVPDGTVMRIRTRAGAPTVVRDITESGVRVYPWICLGCGDDRKFGSSIRGEAREQATGHARDCWVIPEAADDAPANPLSVA
ncbi:hypothetical protein ACFU96_43250 [Streptomyces sp. NPDC057620]|uniref:hypothetical protein n=1 Tax=Streptomyces sp. NPDC057620 TaxID=3346185 RepID=UPI0036B55B36